MRSHLLSWFPRSSRVAAADLKGVLREGDALRLEFATGKTGRAVVPFWVRNPNVAEEIVQLLPTRQSVELEHDAAGVGPPRYRIDWRALALLATPLVFIVAVLWYLGRPEAQLPPLPAQPASSLAPRSDAEAPSIDHVLEQAVERRDPFIQDPVVYVSPPSPLPGYAPAEAANQGNSAPSSETDPYADSAPETPARSASAAANRTTDRYADAPVARPVFYVQPIDGIVPIVPGLPSYDVARDELNRFIADTGSLTHGSWGDRQRIYADPVFADPALWALREAELAVSRNLESASACSPGPQCTALNEFANRTKKQLWLYVRD